MFFLQMAYTDSEMASVRGELEIVQKALKLQTKRCRQLVAEYTRKLQEKELQYRSEKALRDDQLAKVLKALLIFEARLKQEQKYITHQLNEKDYIIKKQSNDIKKLLSNQYCKSCNQYYTSSPIQESLDSSSEYVVTDYQDYQSSNFESLDSSSETYATISEKGYNKSENSYQSYISEENSKSEPESTKNIYQKNRNKDSLGRRSRKIPHRKSIGTYFEVLKLRNDTVSPMSNEDNTSNDYDNLDSLPPESITDKISLVSENIEAIFDKNRELINGTDSSPNVSLSECNNTVINTSLDVADENDNNFGVNTSNESQISDIETKNNILNETIERQNENKLSKITENIPVFEADGETNDNWYASASDQEDEEHRDIYRNNPVLECMNQILLQNINDSLNSPPKTPNVERKTMKNKRVKFSDEEECKNQEPKEATLTQENLNEKQDFPGHDYYETPIQKTPNFYETPQSIYSNDYEQILSKCNETFSNSPSIKPIQDKELTKKAPPPGQPVTHYYVDMEPKLEGGDQEKIVRKSKILRTPPALPPKPANLVSKYKMQNLARKSPIEKGSDSLLDFEPDYCSISELNLPQNKNVSFKKINVVAEINAPTSHDVLNKLNSLNEISKSDKVNNFNNKIIRSTTDYDPVSVTDSLVMKKCVDKLNVQLAKQTSIKSEVTISLQSPKKNNEPEIPKLPQVSEIIIPDENEEKEKAERISQDNYVKNNSQIFKLKTNRSEQTRLPIVIGSSVSSLITGFNNHQLLSEIKKKPERNKLEKHLFSSFENLQNLDKHTTTPLKEKPSETPNFENFDLSQNFEEFKLDDCEIEEYNVEEDMKEDNMEIKTDEIKIENVQSPTKANSSTRVELIRATNDILTPNLNKSSIELLKKQLELQKTQIQSEQVIKENSFRGSNEPTYEHFLECTGLSSKSILTPSRLLSNHKSMLKPKDVKLRSKVKANNLFERHSTSSIKYWSEPYI
ncbi:hypothetical protein NQ314_005920 [Rhamnusium bicolor]|uniref:Uncharacterized protein n=1 Tax=Rhamnusium bicolor TaxID=1586634 RepID=A0AAV8ZCF1_9CUCU|nr:hypothetical protein NQ314_005920 [Rhamnusium bicolor]